MEKIGFIGGGRITRIICRGLAHAGALPSSIIYDTNKSALDRLASAGIGTGTTDRLEEILSSGIIVLALPPSAVPEILKSLNGELDERTIILSLAPKISILKIQEQLGGHKLIARMNPNAPSIIGKGFNPIAFSLDFDETKKQDLIDLLSPLGKVPVIADHLIDSFAVITAMGPTYLDYQIKLLKDLAVEFGIPEELAVKGIVSMVEGTAETVLSGNSGENPLDLVPARPLKEIEGQVSQAYKTRLRERFEMLTKKEKQ